MDQWWGREMLYQWWGEGDGPVVGEGDVSVVGEGDAVPVVGEGDAHIKAKRAKNIMSSFTNKLKFLSIATLLACYQCLKMCSFFGG